MFKVAIFDLDGTLVNTMGMWKDISIISFVRRGLEITDEVLDALEYLTLSQAAEYVVNYYKLSESPQGFINEWFEMAFLEYSQNITLKPGATEYLKILKNKNIRLAIATSSQRDLCEAVLKNNNVLDLFDIIMTSDDVGCNKTKPDIYLQTAKMLNVEPKDCMVFEDILTAIKSAKLAGMSVTAIYDDYSASDVEKIKDIADHFINSFDDLIYK